MVDAVIAGFGRLGEWFGPERWGIRPDMITFAKGVTSGYLPLGGVVISGTIAAPFWDEPNPPWFRHGPTYAGHPTCCAVALANLDIIEREGLLARGLELQDEIACALRPFESHALVGEVRAGTGALGAVALSGEALVREPKAPQRVFAHARDRGVLVRPLGDGVAISPPLIATREDVETAAYAISDALDAVASELGVTAAALARQRPAGADPRGHLLGLRAVDLAVGHLDHGVAPLAAQALELVALAARSGPLTTSYSIPCSSSAFCTFQHGCAPIFTNMFGQRWSFTGAMPRPYCVSAACARRARRSTTRPEMRRSGSR